MITFFKYSKRLKDVCFGEDKKMVELLNAVQQHDAMRVKTLIDEGADVFVEFEGKWQPIDLLWMEGDGEDDVDAAIECLNLLRDAGAMIRIRTLRQLTSEKAPLKIFHAVFENNTNEDEYNDTLYGAILQKNDLEVIRFLLERGADPNAIHNVNPNLPPPADICIIPRQCLHIAIATDDEPAVRLLLEYTDPYAVCKKNGTTSFHWYVTFGKNMKLIGDLWEAKKSFDKLKDRLHKELIEHVFHPARLERLGYFQCDQT